MERHRRGVCPCRNDYPGVLPVGQEDANALLMEVLTSLDQHHVLAAHAPQINIGVEPYERLWAGI